MSRRTSLLLLPVIYLGFISLGLPDGALGVAWPSMQGELRLPFDLVGQMVLVGTLVAMASSFSSAAIIGRFKTGPVVMVSCVLTASAILLFSRAQSALWLLLASLPFGLGAGAVDSGLNGYVARHYSRRHMNWLHGCWGIGATSGPLIMTWALDTNGGWRGGFLLIGSAQLLLALVFLATLRLWERNPEIAVAHAAAPVAPAAGKFAANSQAGWLSGLIYAVYVAVEGSTGLWAVSVLVLSRQISQETAGFCATAYYGSITAGRILVGFAPAHWNNRRMISAGLVFALAGTVLFLFGKSQAFALPALVMIGLGYAPVFPGLMHEVPRRFVPEAVQTIVGRQSAFAYFGSAFAPPFVGWLAVHAGLETIPIFIVLGTLILALCIARLNRLG